MIHLQNIQTIHETQYQNNKKLKQTNKKTGQKT